MKNKNFEIIPGILEKEWDQIEKKINLVRPFAKSIHIDLLDNIFAPNITFLDPEPFRKFKDDFVLELHMMVNNPVSYVDSFAKAGFKRFIGQIEMMPNQEEFIRKVKQSGCEVGLGVDSETTIDKIKIDYSGMDFIFFMTVKAGFSNQSFLPEVLEKIKRVSSVADIPIEIDGGVNDETIVGGIKSGASRFVSTGYLFKSDDAGKQYERLRGICSSMALE